MKLSIIFKILAALAAIAGIVFVIATYGDKIVAWAKKLLAKVQGKCECDCDCECDADCNACPCESDCDECPCCGEEADAEVIEEAPAEAAVSADEADFEG